MLLLNERNTLPTSQIVFDVTVLRCAVLGVDFIAKRDGISTNYARDAQGRIYSDAGVLEAMKRDIRARKPLTVYANGREVTGWKSSARVGHIVGGHVFWHNWAAQMKHITVRMFDGSLWYGKYSHMRGDAVTLRPYKEA